ncbi:MAG TPA: MarR family transcriptional regulator [Kofleriaceae bacterium]|nr:MarR family transcriptional regulator [Kofleriaceae bacterium]
MPERDDPDEILRSIRQVVRRISEHSRSLNRDVGLTVPQLLVLKAIGELEDGTPSVTVAMVSEAVQLSAATTSRIIDRLARAELVTRERNTIDRRKVSLTLTAAGTERFHTLPRPLQDEFIERLGALPAAERRQLLTSVRRIAELMGAGDLDAAPILTPGEDVKSE